MMEKVATVTFDKVEGHTVTGKNIVTNVGSAHHATHARAHAHPTTNTNTAIEGEEERW